MLECLHPNKFFLVILLLHVEGASFFKINLKTINLLQELKIYLETIISRQQTEWELGMEDE